jgi:5-formyltetrahydrofolate cyclo-ligase
MDIRPQKQSLRRAMVDRILALDPDDRRGQEADLADRFAVLPGFEEARIVLIYVSAFPEEIATGPMLLGTLGRGKRLVCPRVDRAERRLRLFEVTDPELDLARGTLGIPEPRRRCLEIAPDQVDWVLVPGLAFDDRGFRLGRGAGHYDRLLPTLRPDAPRWALALDCQWVEALPVEPHDVPLDGIVSPRKGAIPRVTARARAEVDPDGPPRRV